MADRLGNLVGSACFQMGTPGDYQNAHARLSVGVHAVVLIDEFRTSDRNSCCGVGVMLGPARQTLWSTGHLTFDRDTNAANNMGTRLR